MTLGIREMFQMSSGLGSVFQPFLSQGTFFPLKKSRGTPIKNVTK